MSEAPRLPRLYAIVDPALLPAGQDLSIFVRELVAAGTTWLQYRDKSGTSAEVLTRGRELRRAAPRATLVMNDRADLCLAAGFNGVHLGQEDLSMEGARRVVGGKTWIGLSTHNPEQTKAADATSADYIAIGPIFATHSKQNPDPVVGLEGVAQARRATGKPLVAIGGITRANCRDVIQAGADSVAVISDLIGSPGKSVEDFLRILE